VNVEQASKRVMWKPTRLSNGEGRCSREVCLLTLSGEDRAIRTESSTGVVTTACPQEETIRNTGSPGGAGA
jgi:hypothetical protein